MVFQHQPGDHPWDDAGVEEDSIRRSTSPDGNPRPVHCIQSDYYGGILLHTGEDQFEKRYVFLSARQIVYCWDTNTLPKQI